MQESNFEEVLEAVVAKDPRYHRDAYHFVREALDRTPRNSSKSGKREPKHVTAQELLESIRQYALGNYGPMTITVFEEWGIRGSEDFGEIVFNLIEAGHFFKTEKDSREDFKNGYDFQTAFVQPFLPQAKLKTSPAAPTMPAAAK